MNSQVQNVNCPPIIRLLIRGNILSWAISLPRSAYKYMGLFRPQNFDTTSQHQERVHYKNAFFIILNVEVRMGNSVFLFLRDGKNYWQLKEPQQPRFLYIFLPFSSYHLLQMIVFFQLCRRLEPLDDTLSIFSFLLQNGHSNSRIIRPRFHAKRIEIIKKLLQKSFSLYVFLTVVEVDLAEASPIQALIASQVLHLLRFLCLLPLIFVAF